MVIFGRNYQPKESAQVKSMSGEHLSCFYLSVFIKIVRHSTCIFSKAVCVCKANPDVPLSKSVKYSFFPVKTC